MPSIRKFSTNLRDPKELRERPAADVEGAEDDVGEVPEKFRSRRQLVPGLIGNRRTQQSRGQQVGQLFLVVGRQADGQRRDCRALQ